MCSTSSCAFIWQIKMCILKLWKVFPSKERYQHSAKLIMFTAYRISTGNVVLDVSCPESLCQWNEETSSHRCHCDAECVTMEDCCLDHFVSRKQSKSFSFNGFLDLLTRNRSEKSMAPFYSCPSFPMVSFLHEKKNRSALATENSFQMLGYTRLQPQHTGSLWL